MFTIKRFKYLPYVLIGILGLIIAGVSFYFLNNKYTEPVEMKDIVVTAREIPMYDIIRGQDLKTIQVPVTTNTDGFLVEMSDILGKVSKVPLSSNDLILEEHLLNKEDIENIEFITINTLYAQTSGAKPGDIVDVYKVMTEKGEWVEGSQATLLAKDVVVISLTTATGKKVDEEGRMPLGGTEKIEVVKLAVKPSDVKYLVPASALTDNGYVLVVKNQYNPIENIEIDPNLDDILNQNSEKDTIEEETIEEGGELDNNEIIQEEQARINSSTEGNEQ